MKENTHTFFLFLFCGGERAKERGDVIALLMSTKITEFSNNNNFDDALSNRNDIPFSPQIHPQSRRVKKEKRCGSLLLPLRFFSFSLERRRRRFLI